MDLITEGISSVLALHSNNTKQNENYIKNLESIKTKFSQITLVEETFDQRIARNPEKSIFDVIFCEIIPSENVFGIILSLLKPNGSVAFHNTDQQNTTTDDGIIKSLKLSGFIDIQWLDKEIKCKKPGYEIGSSLKLSLNKPKPTVTAIWKINADDDDDQDEEQDDYADDDDILNKDKINPDDLLDDIDKAKPNSSSLKVCGTTGKRKACKDCSCGLADELDAETNGIDVISKVDKNSIQKSSCGSCYLGDAFRCAACPYLGMPAFKPGQKVQITDDLLKSDI